MAKDDQGELCRAVWYHGDPRIKHVCHRPGKRHRGGHHSDKGLWWSRNPHARRVRMRDDPCPDCELVEKALEGWKR